jgi:hypothetical protein
VSAVDRRPARGKGGSAAPADSLLAADACALSALDCEGLGVSGVLVAPAQVGVQSPGLHVVIGVVGVGDGELPQRPEVGLNGVGPGRSGRVEAQLAPALLRPGSRSERPRQSGRSAVRGRGHRKHPQPTVLRSAARPGPGTGDRPAHRLPVPARGRPHRRRLCLRAVPRLLPRLAQRGHPGADSGTPGRGRDHNRSGAVPPWGLSG